MFILVGLKKNYKQLNYEIYSDYFLFSLVFIFLIVKISCLFFLFVSLFISLVVPIIITNLILNVAPIANISFKYGSSTLRILSNSFSWRGPLLIWVGYSLGLLHSCHLGCSFLIILIDVFGVHSLVLVSMFPVASWVHVKCQVSCWGEWGTVTPFHRT